MNNCHQWGFYSLELNTCSSLLRKFGHLRWQWSVSIKSRELVTQTTIDFICHLIILYKNQLCKETLNLIFSNKIKYKRHWNVKQNKRLASPFNKVSLESQPWPQRGERRSCRPTCHIPPSRPARGAPPLAPYNGAFLRLFYVFALIERSFCMMCLVHCAVDASFKMVIC